VHDQFFKMKLKMWH